MEFFSGFPVSRLEMDKGRCAGVCVDVPGRPRHLRAKVVVLASGPFSVSLLGGDFFGTDGRLRPINSGGAVIADNLYATGALLRSTSGQGGNERAVLTGYRAGMLAAGEGERYAAE
jgi:glycerol-3-phosphate dehydrogenase